jgi:IclR family acetate operon transcriptional repressor
MTSSDTWHVARTLRAMELLAIEPRSAPELAAGLQVHVRTARRVLRRLEAEGYVTLTGDARRRYRPTMRIVGVAGQVLERCDLARAGLPAVTALRDQLGCDALLCVPSYDAVLCLIRVGTQPASDGRPQLRELVPSHCTATGKALLAWSERWCAAIAARRLVPHTERTLATAAQLLGNLERTRQRGYAIEDRELAIDVRAVAAPVFAERRDAIAAMGVVAPVGDLPSERIPAIGEAVMCAAAELSAALGADPDIERDGVVSIGRSEAA